MKLQRGLPGPQSAGYWTVQEMPAIRIVRCSHGYPNWPCWWEVQTMVRSLKGQQMTSIEDYLKAERLLQESNLLEQCFSTRKSALEALAFAAEVF